MLNTEELRLHLEEATELDMTPFNADDYLPNEKYHSFLKGCECEMQITSLYHNNSILNKFCKTHNKMCSKTGWEIGWFHGTKSEKPAPVNNRHLTDEEVLEIREKHKTKSSHELCKEYNLTYQTMYGILSGARYKHLDGINLLDRKVKKSQQS